MTAILIPLQPNDPRLSAILEEISAVVYLMPGFDGQRALGSLQQALYSCQSAALYQNGLITAFVLYYQRGETGRIAFVYAMEKHDPEHATKRLVQHAVDQLSRWSGVKVLRCDYSPWGRNYLTDALVKAGFLTTERALMRAESPFSSAGLPEDIKLVTWQPQLQETAAQLLYHSFSDQFDAVKDPRFGQFSSCRQILQETYHGRFGSFDPTISFLVQHQQRWVGLALGSWGSEGDGFIPAIGLVPQARGTGLGGIILGQLLQRFAYSMAYAVELAVTLNNKAAVSLYIKKGFVVKDTFLVYYKVIRN